ncbi:Cd(II)/Pb(II)-responsive transcriptional regulator [Piscinibacterium candidicorallinum]|uniref:Cd(II)/Pb(II)-responsive transcriptional regulator n=2 Tax=Piscinibacterium candidicorallinum TaxID=1793872 RepID=A0ABV7H4I7_9BURK
MISKPNEDMMKIGQLASATDTAVETIRFYEAQGLLPRPHRAENNYRVYEDAHVERLAFIRQCRALGMSLNEIGKLIQFREQPAQDCHPVDAIVEEHIAHVGQRIRELRSLERELKAIRALCRGPESVHGCGILLELDAKSASKSGARRRAIDGIHAKHD